MADNHGVRLPQKLPVYIVYFTVYVRDGQLYFGDDIYGRDEKLKEAVSTTASSGEPGRTRTAGRSLSLSR